MATSKKVLLPDAFWFQEGPGVRRWQFTTSGIKLLNVGNITKEGEIDLEKTDRHISEEEAANKYKHFLCDEGDLVIASSGISFDEDGLLRTKSAFIEKDHLPLCMNTSTIRFKPKGKNDLLFLKYWFDSNEFRDQISRGVTGSAQQNFGPMQLREMEITLPPLPEQKRIAAQLAQADRLRQLRRNASQLGESYLQSAFLEMFGDLVENEKGWEFQNLGKIAEVVSGVTKGKRYNGQETVEVPYLRVANVQDGYLDLSEMKTINVLPKEIEQLRLIPGDVVMTEGGDFDKLGRGAIWHGSIDPCIHQNHIFRVRFSGEKVLPVFFAQFLQTRFTKHYFLKASKQTTNLASINMTQLKGLPVPLPPLPEQERFAQITARYEQLRAQMRESTRQSELLFQGLLHESFGSASHHE